MSQSTIRPHEQLAQALRERIRSASWQPGEMIPGRRELARHYQVALTTVERAVATLISEGLLYASDRRGTFVGDRRGRAAGGEPRRPAAEPGSRARATVGILANVVPYESPELRAGQWPAQILAECEHGLSGQPGVTQRFLNLSPEGKAPITPAEGVRQLLADGIDGLVLIAHHHLDSIQFLTAATGLPLVCAAYDPFDSPIPQVYIDSLAGGALAARHLQERGYTGLTYLYPFASVWSEARLAGARSVTGPDGLRVFCRAGGRQDQTQNLVRPHDSVGLETGRALLASGFARGTGVIAPNDGVALGFMAAAREQGLEPGRDYGLVGFDDYNRDAQLTSLRPPLAQLGREAALLLLRLLRGEEVPARIVLHHRLIARASTLGGNGAAASNRSVPAI